MSPPPITQTIAEFLETGLSIVVGTRNEERVPSIGRALAIYADPDGRRVTVGLPVEANARVLADLRDNGAIAISASFPPDHRCVQIKGRVLGIRDVAAPEDIARMERYAIRQAQSLVFVGTPPAVLERVRRYPAVMVDVEVSDVFEQTPGPRAGEPIAATGPSR